MQYWLATSTWYGIIVWMLLCISDYYLTIYSARGVREIGHVHFEGSFELTPHYQKVIDNLRPVSKLHILLLVAYSVVILIVWWITRLSIYLEWTYPLSLGMFLLLEVTVTFVISEVFSSFAKFARTAVWMGRSHIRNGFHIKIQPMNCIFSPHYFYWSLC